jgi:glutathione S-transferase
LDRDGPKLADAVTIGPIAVACALGYLEFRLSDEVRRSDYPALDDWYARFAQRPSMVATKHPDPV